MSGPRQLILDLLARDKTGPASRGAATNMKTVGDAADDAAKSTEKLGKESDKSDDKVERFGRSSRTASEHVQHLDREIELCEHELHKLAIAFAEAKTAADRADLTKGIRSTQRELAQLNKSKNLISDFLPEPKTVAVEAAKIGEQAGQGFIQSFKDFTSEASGPIGIGIKGGLIAAGITLAPALGATVASAILGGAGIGGVIGGFALAKRDSRVKAATKALGDEVSDSLDSAAGAFVPATLQGIGTIRKSFAKIDGDLKGIFDDSARYVEPLVEGVTGLVEKSIGGVRKAVEGAAPIIDVIKENLPELGATIGDVLSTLAEDGPAAATALEGLFHVIEGGVVVVGGLVDKLTDVYGFLARNGVLGKEAEETWKKYKTAADQAANSSGELGGAQKIMAGELRTAADAAEDQRKALVALDEQQRAQVDPLFAFTKAQRDVKTAQDEWNAAVKRYGPESEQAREATEKLTDASLGLQEAADKVGTTADGKLTPGLRRALTQAGATKEQIKAVETALGRAKAAAEKYDGLSAEARVIVDISGAEGPLRTIGSLLKQIHDKRVNISVGGVASSLKAIGSILGHRAGGGPVKAGGAYIVGEKRPEVFVPDRDGTIIPSVGRASGGSGAAGGSGGGWVAIRGDALIDVLTRAIASQVSAKGGRAAQLGIRFV